MPPVECPSSGTQVSTNSWLDFPTESGLLPGMWPRRRLGEELRVSSSSFALSCLARGAGISMGLPARIRSASACARAYR